MQRIVTPQHSAQDAVSIRPQMLRDFIGQETVRGNLGVFLEAARARGSALDHVLLSGPPGLGKTTLARIVASELGTNFRATSGPVITKAGDLAALLTQLEAGDVLFIDEIHRLNSTIEEVLYPAMEDFELDLLIGEGPTARSVRISLPRFTLIGATTRAGLLTAPLRDRFGIHLQLQFYPPQDLMQVIAGQAKQSGISITTEGAEEIARRARGTPRIAGRLLRRVRDFADVANAEMIDRELASAALAKLEVDNLGLDDLDRRYLSMIAQRYRGGPVGMDTIAASLNEARDVLEEVVEPYLLQAGVVDRTPRGRRLTLAAWQHLGLKPPIGEDAGGEAQLTLEGEHGGGLTRQQRDG